MQVHDPGKALGIMARCARRTRRLRMALTAGGVLLAGCAALLGQPMEAQPFACESLSAINIVEGNATGATGSRVD